MTSSPATLKDRGDIESRTVESGTKPSEQWRIRNAHD